MTKLLETIFRRYILLLLMLLVPTIIGLGIGYTLPRSYQAFSDLWALERFQIIGTTGAESNLTATPADTQTSALIELLQSQAFDVAVGDGTDLKSTFNLSSQDLSNSEVVDNAYVADISKNVLVTAKGTNLYEIGYTNSNPRIVVQVINSVINQFQLQGQQFSVIQGQRLLAEDEAQLTQVEQDANTAAANESAYLTGHPGATVTNDPQYALLDGQRQQAQSTLQNLEATIASLKQSIAGQSAGGGAFFKTLDPAVEPTVPLSRSKGLTTTISAGAAVGFFACILYLIIVTRRDRALYTALDVEKATSYPILMQLPQLPEKASSLLTSSVT